MRQGLLGLSLFALAGIALLIGLGVWQLKRLEWKEGLIAQIEARSKGAPITLEEAIVLARAGHDPSYYRVRVEGLFDHSKERHLYALSADGALGWHVITPLDTADGDMVLIDRGFVPVALKDPSTRAAGQIEGPVTITGLARLAESQGLFTPDNEPAANRWFWHDLAGMEQSMFPTATMEPPLFYLEAEASNVPGGWPKGGQTRLVIPNDHLQYALTWFLLALGLAVVYGLYVRGLYRRDRGPKGSL